MMSPCYLPQWSLLRQHTLRLACVVTPPPFSCRVYRFGSPENIEGHLPEHGVNGILDQSREPSPEGIVAKMRDSKILFHDITDF